MSVPSASPAVGGGPNADVSGAAYLAFLQGVPFFAGVANEELAAFAQTVWVRHLEAQTDIVVQRTYGHAMYVLVSGAVLVHALDPDGAPVRLGRLHQPGDFFGEAALLGRGERTATVTTEEPCVVLEIEKHRFDLLARRYRSVRDHLEGVYHGRQIATYMRMHRYLGQLDDTTRAQIAAGAKLRMYSRDDQATARGTAADSILVIKDGVLKAVRRNAEGGQSILAYFNTDDVIGVHEGAQREFDLIAIGQCEVLSLPRGPFTLAMAQHPQIAAHFGKDDMHRRAALAEVGGTVFAAAQAFLQAGVEVESLLVINLDRCVRCGNCVRACHARHTYTRLDRRGPIFRRRAGLRSTKHEHVMLPSSCRHCRDPECMIGCPTGAIARHADGDVDINDNCIGCENCARKCPYGNITMRPLDEKERPAPEVTKRAIKCNLCRGYSYSNCVHECPRGAIVRVDPLRYFEELALVMEAEQRDAIEWSRKQAKSAGKLGSKQQIRRTSSWFIPASFGFAALLGAALIIFLLRSPKPWRGGTVQGLLLGGAAAALVTAAASLGVRKRLRTLAVGGLEAWTQFHMVLGALGFLAAAAHAGFAVTGIYTTLLMVVFALEVASGAMGQRIYMRVPSQLTRLERHGNARLVEDLLEEREALTLSFRELSATLGAAWPTFAQTIKHAAGTAVERLAAAYDPSERQHAIAGRLGLAAPAAPAAKVAASATAAAALQHANQPTRDTVVRLAKIQSQLLDLSAQLYLHRRLKTWLVVHVAIAAALVVLLAVHILAALAMVP